MKVNFNEIIQYLMIIAFFVGIIYFIYIFSIIFSKPSLPSRYPNHHYDTKKGIWVRNKYR